MFSDEIYKINRPVTNCVLIVLSLGYFCFGILYLMKVDISDHRWWYIILSLFQFTGRLNIFYLDSISIKTNIKTISIISWVNLIKEFSFAVWGFVVNYMYPTENGKNIDNTFIDVNIALQLFFGFFYCCAPLIFYAKNKKSKNNLEEYFDI